MGPTVIFLVLLFFAVFRKVDYGIGGADAYSYLQIFDNTHETIGEYFSRVKGSRLLDIQEPFFTLFNIVFRSVTESHILYFLALYTVIIFGLLLFINKVYDEEAEYFTLILFLCSYVHSFNVIRSWISISICMIAFCYLLDDKWNKSLCLIIIASLFHYMALCFFLVWGCCRLEEKLSKYVTGKRLLMISIAINFLTFVGRNIIYDFSMNTKYSYYENMYQSDISLVGYIPSILICFYCLWNFDNFRLRDAKMAKCTIALFVNMSLFYCIVYLLAWRINDYFALVRMYMLSSFFVLFKRKKNGKIYSLVLYVFIVAIFFQQMINMKEVSYVFPYVLKFFDY